MISSSSRPKYLVTAQLKHSGAVEGADYCEVWDSSTPLPLGHPFQWISEGTSDGIRIRNVATRLDHSAKMGFREISNASIEKGLPIPLPSGTKTEKQWIKLQSVKSIEP